jgi:hypothetical protein
MGAGAYMTLQNLTEDQIKTYVHDVVCMYQNGQEGSELQEFNGQLVQPDSNWPDSGQGVYIEADASGTCALQASQFQLKVVYIQNVGGQRTEEYIGDLNFSESHGTYSATSTKPASLSALIDNEPQQAIVTVAVSGT